MADMSRTFILLLLLTSTSVAEASDWVKVLLPVPLTSVQGRGGTFWGGALYIHNDGPEVARAFPTGGWFGHVGRDFSTFTIFQNASKHVAAGTNPSDGRPVQFLYLEKAKASSLDLQLFLAAYGENRSLGLWEIPVIREEEFERGSVNLLAVPNRATSRLSLRIYDVEARPSADFLVEIYSMQQPFPLLWQGSVRTTGPGTSHEIGPLAPGLFEWHSMESLPELSGVQTLRVRVEPLDDELPFWTMVTATDNTTHQVTTITPQ
jgi:hypothetical protein